MKYLDKKFSSPHNSKAFVDNWDAIFGEEKPKRDEKPDPESKQTDEVLPTGCPAFDIYNGG